MGIHKENTLCTIHCMYIQPCSFTTIMNFSTLSVIREAVYSFTQSFFYAKSLTLLFGQYNVGNRYIAALISSISKLSGTYISHVTISTSASMPSITWSRKNWCNIQALPGKGKEHVGPQLNWLWTRCQQRWDHYVTFFVSIIQSRQFTQSVDARSSSPFSTICRCQFPGLFFLFLSFSSEEAWSWWKFSASVQRRSKTSGVVNATFEQISVH